GGLIGSLFGKFFTDRIKNSVTMATGIATMVMGLGGAIGKMLVISDGSISTQGEMMMIISLVIGAIIGEIIDLDSKIESFGKYLKEKTNNQKDTGFVNAFVTASCTVCIGAMAVVGSIEDGINGNYSILMAKGILDLIIIAIMTSSMGKGSYFSAIPVFIFQGTITLISIFMGSFLSDIALNNLSYVGNVLIFCVGLNIAFNTKIKVANLLPSLVIAVLYSII
ncbi:MAG: DUF554 domain-containing protein, partial [Erysipelotrichaceae bacterium]|nr:DUF554 domain-containing protein [Erysipelotrichaceae bacterium]